MIPACPFHGDRAMVEAVTVGAPRWYTCTDIGGPGGPCGDSAFEQEEPVLHSNEHPDNQITPEAKWLVKCAYCGYAHESAQATADAALEEVRATHAETHRDHVTAFPLFKPEMGAVILRSDTLPPLVAQLADTVTRLDAAQAGARLDKLEAAVVDLAAATHKVLDHLERIAREHT